MDCPQHINTHGILFHLNTIFNICIYVWKWLESRCTIMASFHNNIPIFYIYEFWQYGWKISQTNRICITFRHVTWSLNGCHDCSIRGIKCLIICKTIINHKFKFYICMSCIHVLHNNPLSLLHWCHGASNHKCCLWRCVECWAIFIIYLDCWTRCLDSKITMVL